MASLTIHLQLQLGEVHAGRSDGRLALYDSKGAAVSGLTVTITASPLNKAGLYRIAISGIPRRYKPGQADFTFDGLPDFPVHTLDSSVLSPLLRASLKES